jgi:hypothetical protein
MAADNTTKEEEKEQKEKETIEVIKELIKKLDDSNEQNDKEFAKSLRTMTNSLDIFTGHIDAYNGLLNKFKQEIEKETANKDKEKPKYRFLELLETGEIKRDTDKAETKEATTDENKQTTEENKKDADDKDKDAIESNKSAVAEKRMQFLKENISYITMYQSALDEYGYYVEIIENLDCKNVTTDKRFIVKITKDNGVYSTFDLLEYEQNICDFLFEEQDFIEHQVAKIEGCNSPTVKNIANFIVEYLSYIMYEKTLYTIVYKKIGWDIYDWDYNNWMFKYDDILSLIPVAPGIHGKCISDAAEGLELYNKSNQLPRYNDVEYRDWFDCTIDLLNNHTYSALVLSAGISGLVRQLLPYTKENNININIVGNPASGKSTICHYLLGFFGNPEKIEGSFTDTTNSMDEIRIKRPVLPYVLDERMLRVEGSSDKAKEQTLLMDIFREYEGKVKERVGRQYEEYSGERTYGPIISSSVESMMDILYRTEKDLGQFRRFIEITVDKGENSLFSDSREAGKVEKLAYEKYGIGIRIIIDYMLRFLNQVSNSEKVTLNNNNINNSFEKVNSVIEEKLRAKELELNKSGFVASSKRFALIISSYEILRRSLLYSKYVSDNNDIADINKFNEYADDESFIKDKSEDILEILISNLETKLNKIRIKKSDDKLYDYILSNEKYFIRKDKMPTLKELNNLLNYNNNTIGVFVQNDKGIELRTLYINQLDQFWYMEQIPKPEIICEYIKEVGKGAYTTISQSIELGSTKYNSIKGDAQRDNNRTNGKNAEGKTVYISIKNIAKPRNQVEETGENVEESSKKNSTKKEDK